MRWLLVLALVAIGAGNARGDEPAPAPLPAITTDSTVPIEINYSMGRPPPPYTPGVHCVKCRPHAERWQRIVGTVLAASPGGFLLRGIGSWYVNDWNTGKRLAKIAGLGLGLMLAGGIPTGVSGGNPYLLVPFVPMLVAGTGLFVQSWFADIANAAGVDSLGQPRARVPWSIEGGLVWTHDAYRDRALFRGAARVAAGRLELGATAYVHDTERTYLAGDLSIGVRILGAEPHGWWIDDGSFLMVRGTARVRDDAADHVQVTTGEIELLGRLDLFRVSKVLDGSFAEMSTGGGLERAAFDGASEKGGLLLGRFAYGMYLGRRGEAKLYYDHRRDGFAGGIAAYRAAGFVGSVGAMVDLRIAGRWGMHAELEIGSTWVTSLGLRYLGGRP